MNKIILIVPILLLGVFTKLNAQNRLDTISLYKTALKQMHLDQSVKTVRLTTSKQLFVNINLPNPSYNTLDTSGTKFWHTKDWADFLTKINTSKIKDYTLKTNNKQWFKTFKPNDAKNVAITFSPIIFNSANDKALFLIKYSRAGAGGAVVSAFFEKLNDVWKVKDILQLMLIDWFLNF